MKRRKNPSKSLVIPLALAAGGAYLLLKKDGPLAGLGSFFTDIRDQATAAVVAQLPPQIQALVPGDSAASPVAATAAQVAAATAPAVPASEVKPGSGINPVVAGGAVIGIPLILGMFGSK
jgi:hypothetical protein